MSSAARAAEVTAGQIYEESARQLARWRDRYRGHPSASGAGSGCWRSSASRS